MSEPDPRLALAEVIARTAIPRRERDAFGHDGIEREVRRTRQFWLQHLDPILDAARAVVAGEFAANYPGLDGERAEAFERAGAPG